MENIQHLSGDSSLHEIAEDGLIRASLCLIIVSGDDMSCIVGLLLQ